MPAEGTPAPGPVKEDAAPGAVPGGGLLRRLGNQLYRIRTRLLLVNVLIALVPIAGVAFARFYEREMLRALEADMVHQGQLLRQVLLTDPAGLRLSERRALLVGTARDTRSRIRLLGPDGRLLADSHALGPPEGDEKGPPPLLASSKGAAIAGVARAHRPAADYFDLTKRHEVREALAGRYGAATRVWRDGHRVFLFSALPLLRAGAVQGAIYLTRSTTPVLFAMHRLRAALLRITAATLVATAVLSLFLAGTISRPLGRLTRIAERIAGGDRSARLALERRDEIGQLARAFDRMARKLDERARYIGELAANISHEFKSPLTSLRGAAELLLEGAADDPAARERFLRNMLADARRLDRLVSRLLELSRVEADLAPAGHVELEGLVSEAVAACRGPCPVVTHFRASHRALFGRRAHLLSVLGNLLDNAQQHADPGSPITVLVEDGEAGFVRLAVHNQGNPIRESNLPRIWDRFFTTRASQGGTGLGLPIVKTVVEAHGGRVSVRSRAEEGTTLAVEMPVGRASP